MPAGIVRPAPGPLSRCAPSPPHSPPARLARRFGAAQDDCWSGAGVAREPGGKRPPVRPGPRERLQHGGDNPPGWRNAHNAGDPIPGITTDIPFSVRKLSLASGPGKLQTKAANVTGEFMRERSSGSCVRTG